MGAQASQSSSCELKNTKPLLQDSVIQGHGEDLLSAANEIKLLREESGVLKEQRKFMENEQRQVRQLQEELKVKDELLKRETRKRPTCTKADMGTLDLLIKAEEEIENTGRPSGMVWR
ncbi:hypothetical protein Q5P01_005162 [Channa striata]|uniref:Uncharacterized protein n=1 Tax=Channa striata TaxID=64152 RepID=A0AA88NDA3_CHASR|nr:hypothetical protein Q5P01_005162 [Channa striata]